MFNILVRDSGWIDLMDSIFQDTTFAQTGIKIGDTILINGFPSEFFPISRNDSASWDSAASPCCGAPNFGHYFIFQGSVAYKQSLDECCFGANVNVFVKMENVGLIYSIQLSESATNSNCGSEDLIQLISFNGKPAPQIPVAMGN